MCDCAGGTIACLSSTTLDQQKSNFNTPDPDRQVALIVSLNHRGPSRINLLFINDRQFALIFSLNNRGPSQINLLFINDINFAAYLRCRHWTLSHVNTAIALCVALAYSLQYRQLCTDQRLSIDYWLLLVAW